MNASRRSANAIAEMLGFSSDGSPKVLCGASGGAQTAPSSSVVVGIVALPAAVFMHLGRYLRLAAPSSSPSGAH